MKTYKFHNRDTKHIRDMQAPLLTPGMIPYGADPTRTEFQPLPSDSKPYLLRRVDLSYEEMALILKDRNLFDVELKSCDFFKADFRGVNLKNILFDSPYNLENAHFNGAFLVPGVRIKKLMAQVKRICKTRGRHTFLLFLDTKGTKWVKAGCRTFTLQDYFKRVRKNYPEKSKKTTLSILNYFRSL